jgi:hypothetical protein
MMIQKLLTQPKVVPDWCKELKNLGSRDVVDEGNDY